MTESWETSGLGHDIGWSWEEEGMKDAGKDGYGEDGQDHCLLGYLSVSLG